jgi:hypothetical protein
MRQCAGCGKAYYRANRMRLWIQQNPGHRDGWQKVDAPYCTDCVPEGAATRILTVTQVRLIPSARAKRRANKRK